MRKTGILLFLFLLLFSIFTFPAFADGKEVSIELMITQKFLKSGSGTVIYTFIPESPSAPMPAGSLNGKYQLPLSGSGSFQLPEIVFQEAGSWDYVLEATCSRATVTPSRISINVTVLDTGDHLTAFVIAELDNGEKTDLYFEIVPDPRPPIPITGDEQSIDRYAALFAFSAVGLLTVSLVFFYRKRMIGSCEGKDSDA